MDSFTSQNYASQPQPIQVPSATVDMTSNISPSASPQLSPLPSAPLPNPPFVFPARPASSSAPSSYSRATGRRPRSSLEPIEASTRTSLDVENRPPRASLDADRRIPGPLSLPSFSFPMAPASAGDAENTLLSPPHSPMSLTPSSPRAVPNRPVGHGHRRGGSEFVGGSIRGGDSITVLGTSPTRSESGHASPNLKPSNAARRHARGHSHKRSGAISSHDVSTIMLPPKPNNPGLRGNSAPASPVVFDRHDEFIFPMTGVGSEQEHSMASTRSEGDIRHASVNASVPMDEPRQPRKPPVRITRVGFSDTLEFIPRPLSLVSNETTSTATTVRPSHSVSGSISSLISLTISNTADRDGSPPRSAPPVMFLTESRPSTAGAVLERTLSMTDLDQALPSPKRRNSIPHLSALPPPTAPIAPATPSPTKTPKRWSFFGLEPFVGASSPTRPRPVSAGSSDSQCKTAVADEPSNDVARPASAGVDGLPVLQKTNTRKKSKKQRKVKVWAGSILSRKSKTRHVKHKRRTPTPPPLRDDEDEEDLGRPSCDMLSEPPMVMITEAYGLEDDHSSPPQRPASLPDEDTSFPMIDLDAALGPFNTPLPRNPEWEAAQRAGGLVKKQLHSAAKMNRFTGPGLHYQHRRAESAPEMVPFEGAGRFGIHRFGSSSTMADVFEEDEEDDSDSNGTTGNSTPMAETPGEKTNDPLDSEDKLGKSSTKDDVSVNSNREVLSAPFSVKRKGSDLSEDDKSLVSSRMKSEHAGTSLHDEVIVEEYAHDELPCPGPAQWERSPSATPSPRQMFRSKDLAPVDVSPLNLPVSSLAPGSPYSMTQSSSFPSPRTPVSYDPQRMSTAPSSITEDNFRSLLMGEPGPEVRISMDGVPSLTSSTSTMTRESGIAFNPQARVPPLSNNLPRPASFTSTAFGRRRSSLASLSRLISSSHGERSKLSMEIPMDNSSDTEKKLKISKTKRLSRLVQFWKPKDAKDVTEA